MKELIKVNDVYSMTENEVLNMPVIRSFQSCLTGKNINVIFQDTYNIIEIEDRKIKLIELIGQIWETTRILNEWLK